MKFSDWLLFVWATFIFVIAYGLLVLDIQVPK